MKYERQALLEKILDNPDDDTAKLVYADYMEEEEGFPLYAKMIRESIWKLDTKSIIESSWKTEEKANPKSTLKEAMSRLADIANLETELKTIFPQLSYVRNWCFSKGFLVSFDCSINDIMNYRIIDNMKEIPSNSLEYLFRWNPIASIKIPDRSPVSISRFPTSISNDETNYYFWIIYNDRDGYFGNHPRTSNYLPFFLFSTSTHCDSIRNNRETVIRFTEQSEADRCLADCTWNYFQRGNPRVKPREIEIGQIVQFSPFINATLPT